MDANSQIGFALDHIANFSAAMVQMDLQRFWAETLAQPRYADPRRLLRHGFKVYSQHDEDGIIQEIFRRIGTATRTFVEFGVETGVECNTVKLLIEGWRGLWIEANAQACKAITSSFDPFLKDKRLTVLQSLVTAENINTLIRSGDLNGGIDLLGIDIDFNDYWVWKAIEVVSPRVVVIEYNAGLRPPMTDNDIRVRLDHQLSHAQGYRLSITPDAVEITAADDAGALPTSHLTELFPPDPDLSVARLEQRPLHRDVHVPAVRVQFCGGRARRMRSAPASLRRDPNPCRLLERETG